MESIAAWLGSGAVVGPTGAVVSWVNPDHPGYDYPEAAGLWLALACAAPTAPGSATVDSVAAHLAALAITDDGVGRDGLRYLFDSAAVLNGLVAHARAHGPAHAEAMERLFRFVEERVRTRTALVPAQTGSEAHWSRSYAPHQLKCVVGLHAYADLTGQTAPVAVAEALVDDLVPTFDGRRFPAAGQSGPSYLHACLYAFEGLAYLHARGVGDHGVILSAGASWLSSVQREDGAIRSHFAAGQPVGPGRADATAQAARLWTLLDPERWDVQIARAFDFLASLQSPSGAIRYGDDSPDDNTWVSVFTAQALDWHAGSVAPERMV